MFSLILNSTYALEITPKIEWLYNKLVLNTEEKYSLEKQENFYSNLKKNIVYLKKIDKYKNNVKITNLLDQVSFLNDEQITIVRKKLILINLKNSKYLWWENKEISLPVKEDIYLVKYNQEIENNKKIIDKYSYSKLFKNISYTKNNIFLEDGIWYTYEFKNFSFFPDNLEITQDDLNFNWIDPNRALLFVREDNTLWFVKAVCAVF